MKKVKEMLEYYFNFISLALLIFLVTGVIVLIYYDIKNTEKEKESSNVVSIVDEKQEVIPDVKNIKVDIKGAVKKPGVYEVSSISNVLDLIKEAGGLTKNADTSNINLSRVLEDQMVVKIYTKSEIKKLDIKQISECVCPEVTIDKCNDVESAITKIDGEEINIVNNNVLSSDDSTNETTNKLISINTASQEELMTLNSIGEAKAKAIIEYRNTNGNFKSIEDIKNVSGIGDSLFEKIKSYITV